MSGQNRAGQELYQAVLGKEKIKLLQSLPNGKAEKSIRQALEGVWLPEQEPARGKFLDNVALMSNSVLESGVFFIMECTSDHPVLEGRLKVLRSSLEICSLSSNPVRYSGFMARAGFNIVGFMESIALFAGGRKVTFEAVPEEKRKVRDEILAAAKDGSELAFQRVMDILGSIGWDEGQEGHIRVIALAAGFSRNGNAAKAMLEREHVSMDEFSFILAIMNFFESPQRMALALEQNRERLRELGIYLFRKEYTPVPFDESFRFGKLEGYVAKYPEFLHKLGIDGEANEMQMIVANRRSVQHELQHNFDALICDWDWRINRSPQDLEYRAYAMKSNPRRERAG